MRDPTQPAITQYLDDRKQCAECEKAGGRIVTVQDNPSLMCRTRSAARSFTALLMPSHHSFLRM